MSKSNALAGLIGCYGDSDDESDDGGRVQATSNPPVPGYDMGTNPGTIHPAPIPHCPWSACYDESSGFTYYWNQHTNAVTWEAPPEYLLALKLAQQQLHSAGSSEVSAEEWQLYQQALAEKQNAKVVAKPPMKTVVKKPDKTSKVIKNAVGKKRSRSEDDEEKIELITSYHNSDSESNDEAESPAKIPKQPPLPAPQPPPKILKHPQKKVKAKSSNLEYGPSLPPNQEYTAPIGPEMPPEIARKSSKVNGNVEKKTKEDDDEGSLLKKLKDKAKLLEKLGGELPSGLEKIIGNETGSGSGSPKTINDIKTADIDDLLEEIEKKELPKAKTKKLDIFDEESKGSIDSYKNSPQSGISTPQPLFPSSKFIEEDTQKPQIETDKEKTESQQEKKGNVYLPDPAELTDRANRKKLRISNSVLPVKKSDVPSYTTKYSQNIEGFSCERTGLGFSQNEDADKEENSKKTISYGNGLMFTKGETLNEDKVEDDLDDLLDLLEAKLKHLNELQPVHVTPVQEMLIQLQTLQRACEEGAVTRRYVRGWAARGEHALAAHERAAPPPGWHCRFLRSEKRYKYVRESDGFEQYEYPAVADTDMDICTTPPHTGIEEQMSPAPATPTAPCAGLAAPSTPPPPAWHDPPPPGCDDADPPRPPLHAHTESKKEIGDELLSFYEDIAELEKHPSGSNTAASSPEPVDRVRQDKDNKEREKDRYSKTTKKTKVKISTSMGLKHKTVSSMVAKWQQVADEIHSD